MRLLVVAVLTLAVPIQPVASIAGELCLTFAPDESENAPPHDRAAHDHAAHDASGDKHCGVCANASISAAPQLSLPPVPQPSIRLALVLSPGYHLTRELERPPPSL